MTTTSPSPKMLRRLLRYDPETGKLWWLPRTPDLFDNAAYSAERKCKAWNSRMAGKEAFTAVGSHDLRGSIFNRRYAAHRVAWAVYYGEWPSQQIDHINGNQHDNSISNLRDVDNSTNGKNQRLGSNNTSGANGVVWDRGRWKAQIKVNGKMHHLGRFSNKSDAISARRAADLKYGFHPNHGIAR